MWCFPSVLPHLTLTALLVCPCHCGGTERWVECEDVEEDGDPLRQCLPVWLQKGPAVLIVWWLQWALGSNWAERSKGWVPPPPSALLSGSYCPPAAPCMTVIHGRVQWVPTSVKSVSRLYLIIWLRMDNSISFSLLFTLSPCERALPPSNNSIVSVDPANRPCWSM